MKRIFVVDPDPVFSTLVREVLDGNKITVRFIMSEKDFWDETESGVPDLIVLNFDFNGGEGTRIFSAIKMNPDTASIATIITSAELSAGEIEPYAKLWAIRHLAKPTTAAVLREMLAEHLGDEGLRLPPLAADISGDDIDQVFDSIFPDLADEVDKKEQTDYHITVPSNTFEGATVSDVDLPSDVPVLKDQLLRAGEDLRAKQLLLDRFRDRFEEASRTAEDYRKKVDQLTENATFLHRDVEACEGQTALWQQRHDDLRAEFDRFRQGVEHEAAERQPREQEREAEIARLTAEIDERRAHEQEQEQTIARLTAEAAERLSREQEREQEIIQLTAEASERDQREEARQGELALLTGEVERFRQELSVSEQALASDRSRAQAVEGELTTLREQAEVVSRERDLLVEQVNAFGERERTAQREADARTTQLEAEIIVLKQRFGGLEAERRETVDKLENRIRQLEGEIRDSKERHTKALRLLDEALGLLKGQFELQ